MLLMKHSLGLNGVVGVPKSIGKHCPTATNHLLAITEPNRTSILALQLIFKSSPSVLLCGIDHQCQADLVSSDPPRT